MTPGSEEGQPAGPPAFAAAGYHPGGAEASSYGGAAAGAVVPGETSAVGGPWSAPVGWRPQAPAEPRIPTKRRFGAAVLTAAVVAVVGAPLGWLWSVVAPGVPIIKTDDGAVFATPSPEQFIASDGWFTILLFGLGLVSALVTWVWFKRYRGPWTLAGLLVGTVGASILAWEIGRRIGLDAFHDAVAKAQSGDLIVRPPDLRAGGFTKLWDVIPFVHGDLLMATFGAVIVYTLLAGWSRTPSLRPEPEPQPQPAVNPFYELHGPTPPPATQAGPGESAS
ncbi:DUF2567 domain-containing protein [Asanoa sp. NPDC049573]|uniref:DUF2567 domain-containing protein n=1 Tax=Asanoa sp. NPDC049573 TaxID=3155396 RepID=UPI0034412FAA